MRLGTVRPFSVTGRDRISAAREAVDVVTVMRVLRVELWLVRVTTRSA